MSNEKKLEIGSKPAFPYYMPGESTNTPGMDIRTYLAGQALAGMTAAPDRSGTPDCYAEDAVAFADALLKRLMKEPTS